MALGNGDVCNCVCRQTDTSQPLEFPTTPEVILDYHRHKPFLNNNEEWLVVELNQYECLVDGLEILRIIAKHSKFFEVRKAQVANSTAIAVTMRCRTAVFCWPSEPGVLSAIRRYGEYIVFQ